MREDDVLYWINRLRDGSVQADLETKPTLALVKLVVDLTEEASKVDSAAEGAGTSGNPLQEEMKMYYFDLVDTRARVAAEIEGRYSQ